MSSPPQIPVAGLMYSLNCTVTGAERLTDSTIMYQWFKDGEVMLGTMMNLSFPSLSYSDAGGYNCLTTVMSSLLNGSIITSNSSAIGVNLTCKSLECS